MKEHLEALDNHLLLKNYSEATRSTYGCALRQFLEWRAARDQTGQLTQEDCRNYLLYRSKQGLEWQTINGDYSALVKYIREVLKLDWDVKHIPRPRKEKKLPKILSLEEVKRVIENGKTFKDQVFMSLLYGTGLRLSEALNLRIEDIDGDRLQVRVNKGKGNKDRYVSIPECLLEVLRSYYRVYHPRVYLFNGKIPGQRWPVSSVRHSIKKARTGGIVSRQVSPHVFRHCYATHHLENGTNLLYLKQQLGHAHFRTTAKYIHLCKAYHHQVSHPISNMEITYNHLKV